MKGLKSLYNYYSCKISLGYIFSNRNLVISQDIIKSQNDLSKLGSHRSKSKVRQGLKLQ